jgi:hypothetical protein
MAAIHLPRTIRIGGGTSEANCPRRSPPLGLSRPLIVTDGWLA